MSNLVKFYLSQPGVQQAVYKSVKLEHLERDVMEKALAEVSAAFLQDFGFAGAFRLEFVHRKVGGKSASYIPSATRPVYKVTADNAQTAAILKQNPGWLARFAKNAKL